MVAGNYRARIVCTGVKLTGGWLCRISIHFVPMTTIFQDRDKEWLAYKKELPTGVKANAEGLDKVIRVSCFLLLRGLVPFLPPFSRHTFPSVIIRRPVLAFSSTSFLSSLEFFWDRDSEIDWLRQLRFVFLLAGLRNAFLAPSYYICSRL